MEAIKTPEIITIGFIAISLVGLIYRMLTKTTEVIEKNARAMQQNSQVIEILSNNIRENTQATKEMKSSVELVKDSFTKTLIESMKR